MAKKRKNRSARPTKRVSSADVIQKICSLIHDQTKIDFSRYKMTTVGRRIERQQRLSKCPTLNDFLKFLTDHPGAVKTLCDDLLIHVTEFFRDPSAYTAIRKRALKPLLEAKKNKLPLRIWVPGCSTGEEVYSIAMSISELAAELKLKVPVQIFGTDISELAVQRARAGFFSEEQVKNVSAQRLLEFFEKGKNGYRVKKSLKDMCIFSKHDFTSNPPFAKIDLLSCRNVLIYFDQDLQKHVLPIFHYALNPGGILWLGKSEGPTALSKHFEAVDKSNNIYSRLNTTTPPFKFPFQRVTDETLVFKKVEAVNSGLDAQKEIDRLLMARFAPPGVQVNHDLEIVHVRGPTSDYLELPGGQPHYNLLKMVRPELISHLRLLVQSALKTNKSARRDAVEFVKNGSKNSVNLEVIPLNGLEDPKKQQFFIIFEKGEEQRAPLKAPKASDTSQDSYVVSLLQELDALRDYQQNLSEGFEATKEELTSTNEELQSSLEEYQSTNEELETAKEELQASNEELTTLNEELHDRNQQLIHLNERLAFNEERFRLLVDGVKDYAIFMMDPTGIITTWNEGARRLKGYEAKDIIGKHFSTFYPRADIQKGKPQRELEVALQEGKYEETGERVRKDGTTFTANVVVTPIYKDGVHTGFAKVTRDMTEKMRAEITLRASEQKFRQMVEAVKDYAIFQLDPTGVIATWNEGARRLKGYEASEIIGQHFSKFYPKEDSKKPAFELAEAARLGRVEDEGWRVRKDGTRFWANVVITALRNPSDQLIGFTKVTRDLTERKLAEEKMISVNADLEKKVRERTEEIRNALNARDEFLSIASHELKTPLTSLKLQLQLSQRSMKGDTLPPVEDLRETLAGSLKQVQSLTDLVEDLLDISRIQTGRFVLEVTEFDLGDLVKDVVGRFKDQLQLASCRVEVEFSRINVSLDRHRIEQVIMNLISNAIKYAPRSMIKISGKVEGEFVKIIYQDSGPGISKDMQGKIFERFERANATRNIGGLGLGLFITKKIVEAHGGEIRVEGSLGEGTRFLVDLPVRAKLNV